MAFRGEASVAGVSEVQMARVDSVVAANDLRTVAPDDAFRVRIAIGVMIVVAIIDCALYLPRIF